MAMTQLVVDPFAQYAGFPVNLTAGKWSKYFGSANPMEVSSVGNAASSAGSIAGCGAIWTGPVPVPSNSWSADQYAEITIGTLNFGSYYDVFVRGSLSANTRYVLELNGASTQYVYAVVAGSAAATYTFSSSFATADVWRISVTGTTITVTQNGTTKLTQTDTNIASGNPGFGLEEATVITAGTISKFAAGANATAAPTFSPIGLGYIKTGTTQQVTVSCATVGATIYYTTDGTTPTTGSPTVASGSNVTITYPCLLQALAVNSGINSLISSYNFPIPTPGYGTLLASDNWASGSVSANWLPTYGGSYPVVTGSPKVLEPSGVGTKAGIIYSGQNWPGDQICEITVGALTAEAATSINLATRLQGINGAGGYALVISNGTATLMEETLLGADTTLTTASVTVAAGDVLTLESRGNCHSFYQNGKHILHYYGEAVTSGSPGFNLSSTSNVTHVQVSSWRGYSCVQQDGIWQKQGTLISATAAQTPAQGLQLPSLFLDNNPQILPGPNVYKMWLNVDWGGGTGRCFYAESADGISWTQNSTSVLNGYTNNVIDKAGSTYYMRCQTIAGDGLAGVPGTIQIFTSSDGINWNIQSPSQVVYGGGQGASWDNYSFYPGNLIDIVGGTWYATYLGSSAGNPSLFSTGLITSTDGINWVKQTVSGPLSGLTGWLSQAFNLINGTYYGWFQRGQGGQGNGSLDPIEVIRAQSTDRLNWTTPVKSVHHSSQAESMNSNLGYCISSGGRLFDLPANGGNAAMYFNTGTGDNTPPQIGMISVAFANVPMATVILSPENGITQVAADTFGTSGALSGNWTVPTGAGVPKIASAGVVEPTLTATQSVACYSAGTFGLSQYAQITLLTQTASGSDFLSPIVYCATGAQTYYEALITGQLASGSSTVQVNAVVAGVATPMGPAVAFTPNVADIIRLTVIPTSAGNFLQVFQNEFMLINMLDTLNTITSGFPGFSMNAASNITHAQISAWASGNANSMIGGSSGSLWLMDQNSILDVVKRHRGF